MKQTRSIADSMPFVRTSLLSVTVGLFLLALVANGCSSKEDVVEEQQRTFDSRKAVAAYANGADSLREAQNKWSQAYARAINGSDVDVIGARVRNEVIPALTSYIQSLKSVPTDDGMIKKHHTELVEAHESLLKNFQLFVKDLDPETYNENRRVLTTSLSRFHRAQSEYRKQMTTIYQELGIRVSDPGNST